MQNHVLSVAICIASITVIASSRTTVLAQDGARAMPAQSIDLGKLDPAPKTVVWLRGRFQLTNATQITYTAVEAKAEAESLANRLRSTTGLTSIVAATPFTNTTIDGVVGILLRLDPTDAPDDTGYFQMMVWPRLVCIRAATPTGLANGCKTFLQLLPGGKTSPKDAVWEIPSCIITGRRNGDPADTPVVDDTARIERLNAAPPEGTDPVTLNPRPTMVSWERGKFTVTKLTKIMYSGDGAKAEAESLANKLRPATGFTLSIAPPPAADTGIDGVLLELLPPASNFGAVGFAMQVGKSHVRIMAGTPAGLSNGCKYLLQLLPRAILKQTKQENVDWEIPCCKLFDMPKDGDKSAGMKDK